MSKHCCLCWGKICLFNTEVLSPKYPAFKLCSRCSEDIQKLKRYLEGYQYDIATLIPKRDRFNRILDHTGYIEIKETLEPIIQEFDKAIAPILEKEKEEIEEHKYDGVVYICPKCGNIYPNTYTVSEREEKKCSCGLPLKNEIKTNYTLDIYKDMNWDQTKEWEEMLRKRYVLTPNNSYYNQESYYLREDRDFKRDLELQKIAQEQFNSNRIVCPKCGSTQFMPVRKKWDIVTGFMTNKVDMVCNNCGWIKKG